MYIECYDDNKKTIMKKVEIFNRNNKVILSLGFPYEWEYSMLQENPAKDNKMCVDAMGRNHHNSPVYCDFEKLMSIANTLIDKKNRV
jgi:hypothetical protein